MRVLAIALCLVSSCALGAFLAYRMVKARVAEQAPPNLEPLGAGAANSRRAVPPPGGPAANDPSASSGANLESAKQRAASANAAATQLQARVQSPGRLANLAGIEALERGDLDLAVTHFETAQAASPADDVLRHNLAEALVRRALVGRRKAQPCAACEADLERALELHPARTEIASLRDRWRIETDLERSFWREFSTHFELYYDGAQSDLVWSSGRVLDTLERALVDLAERFSGPKDALAVGSSAADAWRQRPQRVVLYRRAEFRALTGLAEWAGGAYDGTIRVPVENLQREDQDVMRTLRHELVHAFVQHAGGGHTPGWLNEGLAQWLEHQTPKEREQAVQFARRSLQGQTLLTLEQLQGTLAQLGSEDVIRLAYAQSLAWVDHLARVHGEDVPVRMAGGQAFEQLVGFSLARACDEFAQDLARAKPEPK